MRRYGKEQDKHPEKVIGERRFRWLGHVTRMDKVRKHYSGKSQDSRYDLKDQG